MSKWIKSRHQYRATQQTGRRQFRRCTYHLREYESWGKTSRGHMGAKACPECLGDEKYWRMAEEQLGAPANEDKRAVYQLAKKLAGITLYRYLRYDQ